MIYAHAKNILLVKILNYVFDMIFLPKYFSTYVSAEFCRDSVLRIELRLAAS